MYNISCITVVDYVTSEMKVINCQIGEAGEGGRVGGGGGGTEFWCEK